MEVKGASSPRPVARETGTLANIASAVKEWKGHAAGTEMTGIAVAFKVRAWLLES